MDNYAKALMTQADTARITTLNPLELVTRLTEISIALSQERDTTALLERIVLEARSIAKADGGTLYVLNDANMLEYEIVQNDSLGIRYGGSHPAPPFKPVALYNIETGEPNYTVQVANAVLLRTSINIENAYRADGFNFEGTRAFDERHGYRTQSVLTIPMINHKNEAIGCLQLINAQDPLTGASVPFSGETVQIVEALASQAAVSLDNKQLIQAQRNLLESFIKIIAQAIDAKSPYTGNHCERVPVLTEMLAEAACQADEGHYARFNLTDEEKYELHIAGWLHDCGKIVTPVHIMDKSTKLETIHDRMEEVKVRFEVLKRDTRIAYLDAVVGNPSRQEDFERIYDEQITKIESDQAFLEKVNIGGEFMEDADVERIKSIARYQWVVGGYPQNLLSDNEVYNLSIRKGTINPEEREIMNDHMAHTVNMLESMPWPKHLQRVPEYACGHHEKMDGTGYPKGILGATMSVPARMMAVADVFEALTAADRPYKPAKKLSDAMEIIGKLKECNHLDPDLVDFFITSGVYRDYAKRYLEPELIDAVDEARLLAIQPRAAFDGAK